MTYKSVNRMCVHAFISVHKFECSPERMNSFSGIIKQIFKNRIYPLSSLSAPKRNELRPRFRTISLLTLCCHFPSHIFKSLYRCLVADAGMPALPVVENLDVFKDSNLGLRARFKALAVHQFFFSEKQRSSPSACYLSIHPCDS